MNIIKKEYSWNGTLESRSATDYIVLHHRAGDGTADSIHKQHLSNGYVGIGYHFYVRKNGEIYKGRPINAVGAHTMGANSKSVGVCFEGNYEKEAVMTNAQKKSGRAIVSYLKNLYPKARVLGHRELQSTACPGKFFPIEEIKEGEVNMTTEEAVEIIQAKAGLEDETIDFLLCYKYGEELVQKIAEAMR